MKKRFKLWIAYMLILCMSAAVMLPNSKTVRADDTGELIIDDSSFNVYVYKDNNRESDKIYLSTDSNSNELEKVWDGRYIGVEFDFSLPPDTDNFNIFSTKIENYHNLKFLDKQEMELTDKAGRAVGTLTVDVNDAEQGRPVTITIAFNDDY